jgi:hypothetical protein
MLFCEYDGRKYIEGERIDIPDQGKICHCNKAWVHEGGPISSACQPVTCGWESQYQGHLQRGCAPVWKRRQYCPVDWVCRELLKMDACDFKSFYYRFCSRAAEEFLCTYEYSLTFFKNNIGLQNGPGNIDYRYSIYEFRKMVNYDFATLRDSFKTKLSFQQ